MSYVSSLFVEGSKNGEKMNEKDNISDGEFWKRKIKEQWKAFTAFITGCVVVTIGALLVLFWFIETSTIGAMGTATIGEWTLAWT